MGSTSPATSKAWSLRQYLARVLVLTALLPTLLFGMAMLGSQWWTKRESLMLRLDANARVAADALDDSLKTRLGAVTLASRQLTQAPDLGDTLESVVMTYPEMLHALYVDREGRVLMARGRDSAPSPRTLPSLAAKPWFKAVMAAGRPTVSDAFRAWIYVDDTLVSLFSPVIRDGALVGSVQVSIPTDRLVRRLSESLQVRGFDVLVMDRANQVVHASPDLGLEMLDVPAQAAFLRENATPSSRSGDIREVNGLLASGRTAYVAPVAMDNGWVFALIAPKQRVYQLLVPHLGLLGGLLAMTTFGVLWALWRQRSLLGGSIGYLLSSMSGYALGGRMDPTQAGNIPQELQPLARGIGDLGARMNAAFLELRLVLDEREEVIDDRTRSLREAVAELDRLSRTDALTGGLNYRGFQETCDALFRQAQAAGAPLSVLALDIDHFKAYNDRYGHIAGDAVLRRFAGAVRSALQHADDVLARPGGEEFVVFLPATTLVQARGVAERVVARVRDARILHAGAPSGWLTVSVGVAALEAGDAGPEDMLGRADASMYAAKAAGRDRVGR